MRLRTSTSAAAMLLLAACSGTPPATYHTLLDTAGALSAQAPAPYALEIAPVNVPPQVDQPQLMLREPDGQVRPVYGERWAAPLADEIRAAIAARLSQRLGAPDIAQIGAGGMPVWRVQVDVQRFDLPLDAPIALDLTWRVRETSARGALLCWSHLRAAPRAAAGGVTAAVAAQRAALAQAADIIADAIAAGGRPPAASAEGGQTQCAPAPAAAAG